jgi:hypothetical protein
LAGKWYELSSFAARPASVAITHAEKMKVPMLFRSLSAEPLHHIEPAYEAFMKTQNGPQASYGLLFQSEHSRLAGAIAQALVPSVFGDLNADVITAIAHHDYGWDLSDQQQMNKLPDHVPYSFVDANPEDTLPCAVGSIAHGYSLGPLAAALIIRHCCLLAAGSAKNAKFIAEATTRGKEIESALPYRPKDLDRWIAALGFCDLLSLYLCSGSQSAVTLPLAHPEDDANARNVTLTWANAFPCLSESVLYPNVCFFVNGIRYARAASSIESLSVRWIFADSQ